MKLSGLILIILSILLMGIVAVTTTDLTQGELRTQTNQDTVKYSQLGYDSLFTIGTLHDIEIIISDEEWMGLIQDMANYTISMTSCN